MPEHLGGAERLMVGITLQINAIMTLLGGRSVHPVSVKVGGFMRVPTRRELEALKDELFWARDAAVETVRWVAGFEYL